LPTVCAPNPPGPCERPYHDVADKNGGGPHAVANAVADIDKGAMDGFIEQVDAAKSSCTDRNDPACETVPGQPADVMGYHDAREIPNYWAYAKSSVLDDHMFEPVKSWSLPDHLYLVSGWSAKCQSASPSSCANNIVGPYNPQQFNAAVTQEIDTG